MSKNKLFSTMLKSNFPGVSIDKISNSNGIHSYFEDMLKPFASNVLQPNNLNELMCTYNVSLEKSIDFNDVENTISLHRKKYSNTLYTINALNELIKTLNNGVLDKSYSINWNDYKNCILLVQADGYKKIDTKIKEIINLS